MTDWAGVHLFSVTRSSLLDPLTYVRLFGHVLGHRNWSHLMGNIMFILLLGPIIEERYGSRNTLIVILATALAVGAFQMAFFPGVRLMGASSVVFAFIILSSVVNMKEGTIPLTFILVTLLYLGQQIVGIFQPNSVSEMAHIVGGLVGGAFGFLMNRLKTGRR
ncbi:MAG: rhomboid family intramembrane serine protease [Clostridia bacterium]|nr:rhomboid family intramembrane serine protease [Clostridia bacterium]